MGVPRSLARAAPFAGGVEAGSSEADRGRLDDVEAATRWIALVVVMLFAVEALALLVDVAWLHRAADRP